MKTILLVEDSSQFGKMIKNKIESELEATVIWTRNLADTRSLLQSGAGAFFTALLDYHLPDAPDGKVIDEVVAKGIPVVVCTGNIEGDVRDLIWKKRSPTM